MADGRTVVSADDPQPSAGITMAIAQSRNQDEGSDVVGTCITDLWIELPRQAASKAIRGRACNAAAQAGEETAASVGSCGSSPTVTSA
jgi:hypothetical protein